MSNKNYEGLDEQQRVQLQAFDRETRSSSAKLGLARKAVVEKEKPNLGRDGESIYLMRAKYGEFLDQFSRLSTESQQALIDKAVECNSKPEISGKDFLELMADLNRYVIELASKDDPEGEKIKKPAWKDELGQIVKEMEKIKDITGKKGLDKTDKPAGTKEAIN